MALVGKEIPKFVSQAVVNGEIVENFTLDDIADKYIVFFFYPLDFTFVCPTEIHAFQEKIEEFKKRNCEVIGCSVDSPYSHFAWLSTPKAKGGIEGVSFPLIADITKEVSKNFEVLSEDDGVAFRGLFLIDKNKVIRHQLVNDLFLGRSIDEVIRTLDALIFHEECGEVCPANWHEGQKALPPSQEGVEEYFKG